MTTTAAGTQGITEDDIANYLVNTPGFFERHAGLLASVQLANPHGPRAVSLQERQMDMLREKLKAMERKIIEMIRHGQDNVAIADKLHRWTRALMLTTDESALPDVLLRELQHEFLIPQAALRLWNVRPSAAGLSCAAPVGEDVPTFATSLSLPYCGANADFEAASWLPDGANVLSLALIPLRSSTAGGAFGLLVLGSPDATRYAADMGTEFLMRIGDIASAALARLVQPEPMPVDAPPAQ